MIRLLGQLWQTTLLRQRHNQPEDLIASRSGPRSSRHGSFVTPSLDACNYTSRHDNQISPAQANTSAGARRRAPELADMHAHRHRIYGTDRDPDSARRERSTQPCHAL
jgi:hypothetical protein